MEDVRFEIVVNVKFRKVGTPQFLTWDEHGASGLSAKSLSSMQDDLLALLKKWKTEAYN